MSEQICQLCRETPSQNWELIENWTEVKKMVQVIFKIDLLPDESATNRLCICCICNEKLRCVHEFYEMIMTAQERLKIVFVVSDSDEEDTPQELDRGPLKPIAKDRVDNHPKKNLSYECDKCGLRFRRLVALKAHMSSHLSKEEVHIIANPKTYKSKTHKKTHSVVSVPKVQCQICKRWCMNKYILKAHMDNVHSDNGPHICDICQKESPSSGALKRHKQYMHESKRKYSCKFCKNAFKRELQLKEHLSAHLRGALYACQFCEKTFNSCSGMYKHRQWLHPKEYQKLKCENQ